MIEIPARIEPCLFDDRIPADLVDLVVEIQQAADGLGRNLHAESAAELAELVRIMNCYYSNLIEGHNTRPRDIERALAGAELEAETRPLALEARAHVIVQRKIDDDYKTGSLVQPTSSKFISVLHRAFYAEMPEYPCRSSSIFTPFSIISDEGVGKNDELAHDRGDCDFRGFSGIL